MRLSSGLSRVGKAVMTKSALLRKKILSIVPPVAGLGTVEGQELSAPVGRTAFVALLISFLLGGPLRLRSDGVLSLFKFIHGGVEYVVHSTMAEAAIGSSAWEGGA